MAADALRIPGNYYDPPPVICYVDRGQGAAIRRARTRLPGGRDNPVAVIRIPRERMVGSGIGSSLIHEVGHQAAALLDLINSLRPILKQKQLSSRTPGAWVLWERWISEIVADFWSVAKLGISSTIGLMAVVSLPRAFVFRIALDDPHPFPWIRVKLSCAMGSRVISSPAMAALLRVVGGLLSTSGSGSRQAGRHPVAGTRDAGVRGASDAAPSRATEGKFSRGGSDLTRPASRAACRVLECVAGRTGPHAARSACPYHGRARTGAGERKSHARSGEQDAGIPADVVGSGAYASGCRRVRGSPAGDFATRTRS